MHLYSQPTVSNPDIRLPTPPIDPKLGFDCCLQSPSANSSHSSTTGSQYMVGGLMHNYDNYSLYQGPPPSSHPGVMAPQPSQSPYQNSSFAEPSSPANASHTYPSSTGSVTQPMYYQRPLPSGFPPSTPPGSVNTSSPTGREAPLLDTSDRNQWQSQHQHHHYIAHSSATQFPSQHQDRYVCQICNKAFSRPSSLRIHSHSHTGEKPFHCPHKGCGKSFSVRSNMKRHERGCHGSGIEEGT